LIATPALAVRGLRAGYGRGDDIVRGLDLDLPPETITAVIGPNGSGKSTFVKALAGLLRARHGTISVTGTDVTALSAAQRVATGMAYVPQEHNIFATLTIAENLKLATEFLAGRPGVGGEHQARVLALFPDLAARAKTLAGNLSGGQRQMLAFACAMLANPEVLLLDEPSAGLSPRFVGKTMQAVARVRDAGVTVLLVEQNVQAALGIADTALVLVAGRRSLLAPADEVRQADLGALFFHGEG
jgi:branched-chain amino acid transport system ATP-binding protein